MKTKMLAGLLAAAVIAPVAAPSVAVAQDYGDRGGYRNDQGQGDQGGNYRGGQNGHGQNGYGQNGYGQRGDNHWNGDRNGGWDPSRHYQNGRGYQERRLGRNDRIYRGGDGRYYCRRNDGTTGLVIGAIGGGLLGGAIGGNTLGALLGAGGGALLGRSVDRGQVRCR